MNIAICDDESRIREGIRIVLEEDIKTAILRDFSSGEELLDKVINRQLCFWTLP